MLKRFFRDETGLELSEYAVAAALVAIAAVWPSRPSARTSATRINELADMILNGSGANRAAQETPRWRARKTPLTRRELAARHRFPTFGTPIRLNALAATSAT